MKKKLISAILLGTLTISLVGCGGGQATGGSKELVVGVASNMGTFSNLDDNGNLDGYEVAIIKAIDEKLEDYTFTFQSSDFANTLLSLETGKIDLGLNAFEYSDERAEKYRYGKEGYCDFSTYFFLPADSTNEGTWESLAGKLVGDINAEDMSALIIQSYNEKNPSKAINLDYYGDVTTEVVVQGLTSGRWDAICGTAWALQSYNELGKDGKEVVKVGETINDSNAFILFPKDDAHAEIQEKVDAALKELKAEGKLKELSIQYFGFDISSKEQADQIVK